MGQLLVRGLDDTLVDTLRKRAARHGRSVEAEHRLILERALEPETETFAQVAAGLRARTPPQSTDSAEIVRQDRDRNHGNTTR